MEELKRRCFEDPHWCIRVLRNAPSVTKALTRLDVSDEVAEEIRLLWKSFKESGTSEPEVHLVKFLRKDRVQINLLKIIMERLESDAEGTLLPKLESRMEELNEKFEERTLPLPLFKRAIQALRLDLDEAQTTALAERFQTKSGRINYGAFLNVVKPKSSLPHCHLSFSSEEEEEEKSSQSNASSVVSCDMFSMLSSTDVSAVSSTVIGERIEAGPNSDFGSDSESSEQKLEPNMDIDFSDDNSLAIEDLRHHIIKQCRNGIGPRESFAFLDKLQSGVLYPEYIIQAMQELGLPVMDNECTVSQITSAFRGQDGAGIDYDRFLNFLESERVGELGSTSEKSITSNEPLTFHDVERHGPFVAGVSKSRKPRHFDEISINSGEEFVRQSRTSIGFVRQAVRRDRYGRTTMERHQIIPNGEKKKRSYVGLLQREESEEKSFESGRVRETVKFLGYPAQVCNDFPRKSIKARHSESILARNFQKIAKKTASQEMKNKGSEKNQAVFETVRDDDEAHGQRIRLLQGKVARRERKLLLANILPKGSDFRKVASQKLHDNLEKLTELEGQLQDATSPSGPYIMHLIAKAQSLCLLGGWQKANKVLDECQLLLKSYDGGGSRALIPVLDCDICIVREVFLNSLKSKSKGTTIEEIAQTFSDQFNEKSNALGRFADTFENDSAKTAANISAFLRKSVLGNSKELNWVDFLSILRCEPTYMTYIDQIQSYFCTAEVHTLRKAFVRSCDAQNQFSCENFHDTPLEKVDGMASRAVLLGNVECDEFFSEDRFVEPLQEHLPLHEEVSWEELLVAMLKSLRDIPRKELRFAMQEVRAHALLVNAQRFGKSSNKICRATLREGEDLIEKVFSRRISSVGENHASLLTCRFVQLDLREMVAKMEAEDSRISIEDICSKYLNSRPGKADVQATARMMMGSRNMQSLAKCSRSSAEIAAREAIRKKKIAELSDRQLSQRLSKLSQLAEECVVETHILCDDLFGPMSLLSTAVLQRKARLLCFQKKTKRTMEVLKRVLCNLNSFEDRAERCRHQITQTANRLAELLRDEEQRFIEAGQLFLIAGDNETMLQDKSKEFMKALKCFEQDRCCDLKHKLEAVEKLNTTLDQKQSPFEAASFREKQGKLLLQLNRQQEAIVSFVEARSCLTQSADSKNPRFRRKIATLNRIIRQLEIEETNASHTEQNIALPELP